VKVKGKVDMKKAVENTNPIENQKSLENLVDFFKGFNKFFENDMVDKIVKQEFNREYALLPLLVKAQLYYDNN